MKQKKNKKRLPYLQSILILFFDCYGCDDDGSD